MGEGELKSGQKLEFNRQNSRISTPPRKIGIQLLERLNQASQQRGMGEWYGGFY